MEQTSASSTLPLHPMPSRTVHHVPRDVVPVPIPKYQNWYPYPSTHCGTRTRIYTRVSTWLGTRTRTHFIVPVQSTHCGTRTCIRTRVSTWFGTRTRTHTHFIVPVPEYQYSHPYLYLGTCSGTQLSIVVPAPVPIPVFQHGLVLVPITHFIVPVPKYLYSHPYPGACSGTRTCTWYPTTTLHVPVASFSFSGGCHCISVTPLHPQRSSMDDSEEPTVPEQEKLALKVAIFLKMVSRMREAIYLISALIGS